MLDKLQELKEKMILNFYKNKSNYFDEAVYRRTSNTFQFEENPFAKKAHVIDKNLPKYL